MSYGWRHGKRVSFVMMSAQWSWTKQPNILVLWGDDIGYWNVSAYNQGMMGYKTLNIDCIANTYQASLLGRAFLERHM